MSNDKGITFDLGLPSGQLANFRFDNRALLDLQTEAGDTTVYQSWEAGQWVRAVTLLLWAARLHEERWPIQRASAMIDRYAHRTAGPPPERPQNRDRAARRAYTKAMKEWGEKREEGMNLLRIALGDAMVEAGEWPVNFFDREALDAEIDEPEVTGPPEDVSGVVMVGKPADPSPGPGSPTPESPAPTEG